MTREEMLEKLSTVEFEMIDPPSDWSDIGFTERQIWVNSKGYGYLACDDPNTVWKGEGLSEEKWKKITNKICEGSLSIEDIEDTSLVDMLDTMYYGDFDESEWDLCEVFAGILDVSTVPLKGLYCLNTFDGIRFFSSEEEFLKAYERDWCDYEWKGLDDDVLICWIERLFDTY